MNIRRHLTPTDCTGANSCPAILQLDTGDYLVIGKTPGVPNITARELAKHGASIGPDEQAVVVPAEVLHAAALHIAEEALTRPMPGMPIPARVRMAFAAAQFPPGTRVTADLARQLAADQPKEL